MLLILYLTNSDFYGLFYIKKSWLLLKFLYKGIALNWFVKLYVRAKNLNFLAFNFTIIHNFFLLNYKSDIDYILTSYDSVLISHIHIVLVRKHTRDLKLI